MDILLQSELNWIDSNVGRYDSPMHANSVKQNIIKRYRIHELKKELNDLNRTTLKQLDKHNKERGEWHCAYIENTPIKNGIACPDCGNELIDPNPMITLPSFPPKKDVKCESCGYTGYRVA